MLPLTRRSSVTCASPVMVCVCRYSRMAGLLSRGGWDRSQLQEGTARTQRHANSQQHLALMVCVCRYSRMAGLLSPGTGPNHRTEQQEPTGTLTVSIMWH
jgi:hypothetical protein